MQLAQIFNLIYVHIIACLCTRKESNENKIFNLYIKHSIFILCPINYIIVRIHIHTHTL